MRKVIHCHVHVQQAMNGMVGGCERRDSKLAIGEITEEKRRKGILIVSITERMVTILN